MKNCGNCGWAQEVLKGHNVIKCSACRLHCEVDYSCPAWKPIIPAEAKAFEMSVGVEKVRFWAVKDSSIMACGECAFYTLFCDDSMCKPGEKLTAYRIVAVEMVEGE